MKLKYIMTALIFVLPIASCQSPQNNDSVVNAKIDSANTTLEKISPANTNFLILMVDGRLMNLATGEMAEKKGTTKAIKDFGRQMVMDQEVLLEEIRSLAQMNGVTLPKEISDEKKVQLNELRKLKGRKFDKQLLTLSAQDHEHDIKKFHEVIAIAGYANDPAIEIYAKTRLPMIEGHLSQAQRLLKKSNTRF